MPEIRTWKLRIAFDGTLLNGWQIQDDVPSVQDEVQKALASLYDVPQTYVNGSGRTDAGVHALGLCASFEEPKPSRFSGEGLRKGVNALLPASIRVLEAEEAPAKFHGRFNCIGKTYCYLVDNAAVPNPLFSRYAWHHRAPLDLDKMNLAAAYLEGTHDYSAFTVKRSELKGDAVRTILRAGVVPMGSFLVFHFTGTGFLYKQVRSMTGELVGIGLGKASPSRTAEVLAGRQRALAGQTAPAHGLILLECCYSGEALAEAACCDVKGRLLDKLFNFSSGG
ncbi:MAG: hypothetical protein RL095_868 [Verrucomicrobiota bacterium]|jgi:tRNA pseudouridine38-40 synthase